MRSRPDPVHESRDEALHLPGRLLADHIAVPSSGAPFQAQIITRDQRRQPDYLALNPTGAVPVLQSGERADAQLSGKLWLIGHRSIADPYLFVVTQWAKKTGVDLSGLDNLAAFDARTAADPGVQAEQRAEGLI